MEDKKHEELMELKHEAQPGYPIAFYTVFVIAVIYLVFLFVNYLH